MLGHRARRSAPGQPLASWIYCNPLFFNRLRALVGVVWTVGGGCRHPGRLRATGRRCVGLRAALAGIPDNERDAVRELSSRILGTTDRARIVDGSQGSGHPSLLFDSRDRATRSPRDSSVARPGDAAAPGRSPIWVTSRVVASAVDTPGCHRERSQTTQACLRPIRSANSICPASDCARLTSVRERQQHPVLVCRSRNL